MSGQTLRAIGSAGRLRPARPRWRFWRGTARRRGAERPRRRGVRVKPNAPEDQSRLLQRAAENAAGANLPLYLPPGSYRASGLRLPSGTAITASAARRARSPCSRPADRRQPGRAHQPDQPHAGRHGQAGGSSRACQPVQRARRADRGPRRARLGRQRHPLRQCRGADPRQRDRDAGPGRDLHEDAAGLRITATPSRRRQ